MRALIVFLFCLFHFSFIQSFAQNNKAKLANNNKLIQFSGIVVDLDSLKSIPYTNIFVKHTLHGTIADLVGYFSFVAQKGDTIVFSEIGYAKALFVISDTLSTDRYSLIQMLHKDTVVLNGVTVHSWPTREQFRQAFLNYHPAEDDLDRARKNLAYNNMRELYNNMPMDGAANYKYNMEQHYSQLYSLGQYPTYNILNPIAWAQFIEAWQRGDFKNNNNNNGQ